MRKTFMAALVGAMVITAVGAATPASAGSGGSCASGKICLYENNDFNIGNTDHWIDFTTDHSDFTQWEWLDSNGSQTNDVMDNETSAIKNRRGTGCTARLWQHVGYSGASSDFANNADDGYLANNSIGDNRASAIEVWC